MSEEHDLVEVKRSENELSVEDGELRIGRRSSEREIICRECDTTFESDEAAVEHTRSIDDRPLVKAINEAETSWEVEDLRDSGGDSWSVMLDLSYNGMDRQSEKISIPVMRAVHEAGYIVSGTHTGVNDVDARLWAREEL